MVRSLESYAEYYRRWSLVWEAQALLRARPMAGDDALADGLHGADRHPIRYPESLSDQDVREVRRVKARVEAERLPRGADPARHLKLGRGGLSDVEWLAQLLQLQHAGRASGAADHVHRGGPRRGRGPGPAGRGRRRDPARGPGGWRAGSVRPTSSGPARSSDLLPSSRRDLEAVARWCGYGQGNAAALEEDYLRLSRRARAVFERVFYGQ